MRAPERQTGFTLVEMIMVIVITGIIGGIVAVFLKAPIQQYIDVGRRAGLTDVADTAILRMARDVRTAVPNSVRVANCGVPNSCVEYLPTRDGGRYRALQDCSGACTGDPLTFGAADSSFDIIGSANFAANDYIVVGSTQSDGNPPYDQTSSGILRAYTGAAGSQTTVSFNNSVGLPPWAALPSQRFDVVDGSQQAVTYACVGTLGTLDANQNGQASLVRYWHYGFNPTQANPPVTTNHAILANYVSGCTIDYTVPNQRFGLLAIRLTLTSGGESVSLYNEIHVNNAP
ncbi:MAG: prepilin-type N-terminal cleavage/methylation domain-containing protein [Gallionella sp.]